METTVEKKKHFTRKTTWNPNKGITLLLGKETRDRIGKENLEAFNDAYAGAKKRVRDVNMEIWQGISEAMKDSEKRGYFRKCISPRVSSALSAGFGYGEEASMRLINRFGSVDGTVSRRQGIDPNSGIEFCIRQVIRPMAQKRKGDFIWDRLGKRIDESTALNPRSFSWVKRNERYPDSYTEIMASKYGSLGLCKYTEEKDLGIVMRRVSLSGVAFSGMGSQNMLDPTSPSQCWSTSPKNMMSFLVLENTVGVYSQTYQKSRSIHNLVNIIMPTIMCACVFDVEDMKYSYPWANFDLINETRFMRFVRSGVFYGTTETVKRAIEAAKKRTKVAISPKRSLEEKIIIASYELRMCIN